VDSVEEGRERRGLVWAIDWFYRYASLTALWWAASALGLFAVGVLPATAALSAVIRQWAQGHGDEAVGRLFWRAYRREFLAANLAGYAVLALIAVLYLNLRFLASQPLPLARPLEAATAVGLALASVILLFLFPVQVHFDVSPLRAIWAALVIAMSAPLRTLAMLGLAYLIRLAALELRGLAVVFAAGLLLLLVPTVVYWRNPVFWTPSSASGR
jgi:uncharacterized membrane protein YesL